MSLKIAYLSQGRLYVKEGNLATQEIVCQFGQDMIDRATRRFRDTEWKRQNQGAMFNAFWTTDQDPSQIRVNITAVTAGDADNELLFALGANDIGGLFVHNLEDQAERRLVHKQDFRIRDLTRHPEIEDLVACSHYLEDGSASIGLVRKYNVMHVTEGDSIDEAPSWIPGNHRRLLFQSAGIGRGNGGYVIGWGPFVIQKLDLDRGAMETLKENPKFDFLLPRMDKYGNLYFIRRPYVGTQRRNSWSQRLNDIVLFPFRILRMLFDFLNFQSMMYSRKPLTTSGGPQLEGEDIKTVFLRGRRIDVEKALQQAKRNDDAPALVPKSWELVKRTETGEETVLAKHVAAYDVNTEGELIYSNGTAIYQLTHGKPELLVKGQLIDGVFVL